MRRSIGNLLPWFEAAWKGKSTSKANCDGKGETTRGKRREKQHPFPVMNLRAISTTGKRRRRNLPTIILVYALST